MKIIGFAQLYNEQENGNLENFIRSMNGVCDFVYVYDQKSTDSSRDLYEQNQNWKVIYSDTNDFLNEIICKARLMHILIQDHPDVDWVLWMDGDTLLDGRLDRQELESMLRDGQDFDGIVMPHYNLWRSDVFYRIDNNYHAFETHGAPGVLALWNARKVKLEFSKEPGLHKLQTPETIKVVAQSFYGLIHRGFATDDSIIRKYNTYYQAGMRGYALDRLLDERSLEVSRLQGDMIPSWFKINDKENPRFKKLIIDIYKEGSWKR